MPEENSSHPGADIWYTHESIIRKLYLDEKKTLRKVKEIMELEHGFPSFPLSTYGTKLRDQLNLPKKLKKKDWPVVYQHYQQRHADGKKTHMYLNDTFIPWKKAWKEIQRSRVPLDPIGAIRTPLPRGVMLKTPPPVSAPNCNNILQWGSMSSEPQSFQIVPNIEKNSSELSSFYHQFSLMCLEHTPWFTLRKTLLGKVEMAKPTHTSITNRQFPYCSVQQIRLEYSNMLNSCALILPVSYSTELSAELDPFYTLASVIYMVSNNFLWPNDRIEGLLDFLFARVPQRLVSDLLHSNLPSIRALWDIMGQNINLIKRRDIFVSWMKLGLSQPTCIMRHGHNYLSQAVSMGCIDIVRNLLQLGFRADEELPNFYYRPAIYEATASQDTKCLELLVKSCDVNRPVTKLFKASFSSFSLILFSMGNFFKGLSVGNMELEMHPPSLKVLLEYGADVDVPCPAVFLSQQTTMQSFFTENKLAYDSPSLLEYCYYCNKQMYYQLVPFSKRPAWNLCRDEISLIAAMGHSELLNYLTLNPCFDPPFLGSILAEQLLLGDQQFDSSAVRALLELGVTISTPTPQKCYTTLLFHTMQKARNLGYDADDVFIMKTLISRGALLSREILATAIADEGIGTLELTLALGANFRREGAFALRQAARLKNFAAVSWLLHKGVDINAPIEHLFESEYALGHPLKLVSIAVAAVIGANPLIHENRGDSAECNMLNFLFDHGAKIWVGSPDTSPFTALRVILRESLYDPYLFDKVRLILDHETCLKELPHLGIHLLEASLPGINAWRDTSARCKVFKFLWENGAPVHPGGVLAALINCGAPHQLVLDLINSGADINARMTIRLCYNPIQTASRHWHQSLVSVLLEHGADINSPAFGDGGATPLQAACSVTSRSEGDSKIQMDFIQFLLRNNADVNAPAAKHGSTALQYAALTGNLRLLSLLLSHGALVNMPNHFHGKRALDFAASEGRLDALHFLLKAGALSYCHGQSGYEGAIRLAKKTRYFVLVDSLQEHVRNNETLFREQPALAAAHYAAMEDRDWTDDRLSERW